MYSATAWRSTWPHLSCYHTRQCGVGKHSKHDPRHQWLYRFFPSSRALKKKKKKSLICSPQSWVIEWSLVWKRTRVNVIDLSNGAKHDNGGGLFKCITLTAYESHYEMPPVVYVIVVKTGMQAHAHTRSLSRAHTHVHTHTAVSPFSCSYCLRASGETCHFG